MFHVAGEGENVVEEGDVGDSFYIVVSGECNIEKLDRAHSATTQSIAFGTTGPAILSQSNAQLAHRDPSDETSGLNG
jgi:hypothetical protein